MEQEILKQMPPFTLDLITFHQRVVDGINSFTVAPCPTDPEQVVVESYLRPGTIDSRDFSGFSSAQL